MEQRWAAAIAAAGEQPPADLSAAVAEELIALWSDLGEAMRRAGTRSWSVECDGLVVRIVMLTRLTAATSWQWIPAPLLDGGVYQGILRSAGIAFTEPVPGRDPRRGRGPQAGIAGPPAATGPGTLAGLGGEQAAECQHGGDFRGAAALAGRERCGRRPPPGR